MSTLYLQIKNKPKILRILLWDVSMKIVTRTVDAIDNNGNKDA